MRNIKLRSSDNSLDTMKGQFLFFFLWLWIDGYCLNVIEFNICHIQSLICILVLIGYVSSLARTKWCRLLLVVPLLMKSIMPTSNLPRLCYSAFYNFFFGLKLLTIFVLYYLVFYIFFGILFHLRHGDDGLLITDMPKEEVERYHLSLEAFCFFPVLL